MFFLFQVVDSSTVQSLEVTGDVLENFVKLLDSPEKPEDSQATMSEGFLELSDHEEMNNNPAHMFGGITHLLDNPIQIVDNQTGQRDNNL